MKASALKRFVDNTLYISVNSSEIVVMVMSYYGGNTSTVRFGVCVLVGVWFVDLRI